MAFFPQRLSFLVLAGALILNAPPSVLAQSGTTNNFRVVKPVQTNNQRNTVVRNNFNSFPGSNPYYGSSFYGYYPDPVGSYLSGVSDCINAEGNYLIQRQQAHMVEEDVKRSKIDTRRKTVDEYLYERDVLPTAEDDRERNRFEALKRSRNDPPITEIWSGLALNNLLVNIQRMQSQRGDGPTVPLDEDVLKHLNLTSGQGGNSSIGLIKNGGKLSWPLPLRGRSYQKDRERLNELAAMAFKEAQSGAVSDDTLQGMIESVANLQGLLHQNIAELTTTDHIRSKRFLTEMEGTIKALQDPNVAKYLGGQWTPQGNTVGELVQQMTSQGLKFAPAVEGGKAAYQAMHTALVNYDVGLMSMRTARR